MPASFSESEVRTVTIFVEPPTNEDVSLQDDDQKNDEKPTPQQSPSLPQELPTEFVTGNEYALNSYPILISSDSGIALNNLLIEQIDEWKNPVDRYDDFYPGFGSFSTEVFEDEIIVGALNMEIKCGVLPSLLGMSLTIADCTGILGLGALKQQSFLYAPRSRELILNAQ